jgi:hypothetical protein
MKIITHIVLICLFLAGLFSSCKKTMELPALPDNKILEYKVIPAPGDTILGAINQVDKTITLYLPFYYNLTAIDPVIKLSAGARLKEQSLPVDVLSDNTSYIVIGPDQSTNTYKLNIVPQQISPLVFKEFSTASETANWGIGETGLSILGNFNTQTVPLLHVYLVGPDGKENELLKAPNSSIIISGDGPSKIYSYTGLGVPATLEPGSYKVRAKILKLTADSRFPVNVSYKQPQVAYISTTVKQGDTFTIRSAGNVFHNFQEFYILVNGVKTILPIEKYTRTEASIRTPENIPVGRYFPIAVFQGFPEISIPWQLTVNAK